MVVRSMDIAIAVCLLSLLLHIFWIRPVSLSVWRWVDAAGLFAFYVFVRQSSSKGIKILLACVLAGGVIQCLYAGMQGMGLLPSLHNAFPMTGSFLNPAPLAGYLAVLLDMRDLYQTIKKMRMRSVTHPHFFIRNRFPSVSLEQSSRGFH